MDIGSFIGNRSTQSMVIHGYRFLSRELEAAKYDCISNSSIDIHCIPMVVNGSSCISMELVCAQMHV